MDTQVNRLVDKVWSIIFRLPSSSRYLIAISGIPGSGKTSLARVMAREINARYLKDHPDKPLLAIAVSMDGYHLTRAQLAAMPDPEYALARRGAAWTFDPLKFIDLVRALRQELEPTSATIYAPSFDHAIKDPVDNEVPIASTARVILFEGNYLSLDQEPWSDVAKLMDELWFVNVDFDVAKRRLIKRHLRTGVAETKEEAEKRVVESDLVNGLEIVKHRLPASESLDSIEDAEWVV